MNLEEMKKKVLGMIEELNPDHELLTDDPDIATKINDVTNQILFECARVKKIPKYAEIPVTAGSTLTMEDIAAAVGYEIYQIAKVGGVSYCPKADGTVLKIQQTGTAEVECYVYPERITEKTKDKAYEFELSQDVLEVLPYGIAADLLKSDVSAEYGRIYAERYEMMLRRLDPRYQTELFTVEGGLMV